MCETRSEVEVRLGKYNRGLRTFERKTVVSLASGSCLLSGGDPNHPSPPAVKQWMLLISLERVLTYSSVLR